MFKFLFVVLLAFSSLHAEFVVVANKEFPSDKIESKELKKLFLRKQKFVSSLKIVPFNLPKSSELRSYFENKILKMSESSLKAYWMQRHYDGVRPPKQVSSVSAMKNYVLKVAGAIGYLPRNEVSSEMKILTVLDR